MQKRLNKFLAESGRCSRREADEMITAGRVTVNGNPAELGMQVSFEDDVRIDGKLVGEKSDKPTYLAFNKPPGIECTTNTDVRDNIIDYINYPKRIFPIGRLDKASEGLIFLTDDGDIVNKILRARNNHEKEYIVTVDKPVSPRFVERMGGGVPILDTVTRECFVEQTGKFEFRIILTQGLNRQIRRMCEYLGYGVQTLKRVRIINIQLDLPLGRYRELTDAEITELQTLIEPSSKTEEASLPKEKPVSGRKWEKREDGPKRDFEKKDFQKRDFQRKDFQKKDFQKKEFGDRTENRAERPERTERKDYKKPERNYDKPERKDYKKPQNSDRPERSAAKDSEDRARPNNFPSAPKRFEIIKKDDPRYRNKEDF